MLYIMKFIKTNEFFFNNDNINVIELYNKYLRSINNENIYGFYFDSYENLIHNISNNDFEKNRIKNNIFIGTTYFPYIMNFDRKKKDYFIVRFSDNKIFLLPKIEIHRNSSNYKHSLEKFKDYTFLCDNKKNVLNFLQINGILYIHYIIRSTEF